MKEFVILRKSKYDLLVRGQSESIVNDNLNSSLPPEIQLKVDAKYINEVNNNNEKSSKKTFSTDESTQTKNSENLSISSQTPPIPTRNVTKNSAYIHEYNPKGAS